MVDSWIYIVKSFCVYCVYVCVREREISSKNQMEMIKQVTHGMTGLLILLKILVYGCLVLLEKYIKNHLLLYDYYSDRRVHLIFFYIVHIHISYFMYQSYSYRPLSWWSLFIVCKQLWGFPCGTEVKNLPANSGDAGLIPGSGRSSEEGNGYTLQYSCQDNPMDRGVRWAIVHELTKESQVTM